MKILDGGVQDGAVGGGVWGVDESGVELELMWLRKYWRKAS